MRKAKIVATIGPASRAPETLDALIVAGVDVVRVNFAHGDVEDHRPGIAAARSQAADAGRVIGVLADLPGPKVRSGDVASGEAPLRPGATFVLTKSDEAGNDQWVSTSFPDLASAVSVGREIFLADGAIILSVKQISGDDVVTDVVRGGILRSRKGMHVPGTEYLIEAFTPGDRVALAGAAELRADYVGLSFVRTADDVKQARAALASDFDPWLVAKIETRSALENLDDIIAEADVLMIARGDLGIQMPLKEIPAIQKQVIAACNRAGKTVITATQMLESMTRAPLPTRAEVSDVANAVLDGTDALMLSEETAIGQHPAAVVITMAEIIGSAEQSPTDHVTPATEARPGDAISWAIAAAAVHAADDVRASAILCPTRTGATLQRVAAYRPRTRLIALAEDEGCAGKLGLTWGAEALPAGGLSGEDVVGRSVAHALKAGAIARGDLVVVVAGSPRRSPGTTDLVQVVEA